MAVTAAVTPTRIVEKQIKELTDRMASEPMTEWALERRCRGIYGRSTKT